MQAIQTQWQKAEQVLQTIETLNQLAKSQEKLIRQQKESHERKYGKATKAKSEELGVPYPKPLL